jgi:two-component system NarL family response regulator
VTEIRVALVEDHPAIAEGLAALIGQHSDLRVVGTAGSAPAAHALIEKQTPDVVVCDIRLANSTDGLAVLAQHVDGAAFVMLSSYSLPSYSVRAMELGARGYLSKLATIQEIVSAIRVVASGGVAFSPEVRSSMGTALRRPTPRELEIIGLLAAGEGNIDIARHLGLRVKTVESQLRRLFDRYDVASRSGLVHLAQLQGWLDA